MSEIVTRSHSDEAVVSIAQLGDIELSSISAAVSAAKPICVVPIGRQSTECAWHIAGTASVSRPWEVSRIDVESGQQQLQVGVAGFGRSQSRESS